MKFLKIKKIIILLGYCWYVISGYISKSYISSSWKYYFIYYFPQ